MKGRRKQGEEILLEIYYGLQALQNRSIDVTSQYDHP